MGRRRWRTSYIDPAELRRAAPLEVMQIGGTVALRADGRLYLANIEEFGEALVAERPCQTTWNKWLRDTARARIKPIPGIVIALG